MDIKVPDSWLREFLTTSARPQKIADCLSLCGPSIERVEKVGKDWLYSIEVTTNRVDSAGVVGIAREAAAILPRFKIQADLKPFKKTISPPKENNNLPLSVKCGLIEVNRVMAVVIDGVGPKESPLWLKRRLELAGTRSLNLLIDITNYVMLEVGHPTHVFDYDRIKSHELRFRKSQKGEKIKTLENKTYDLMGNDIVIDDEGSEIIDLPGIIGTSNSVVTPETKRIIFFIDNNDPVYIRKTSMHLGIRTTAVTLNEKGVDPELASVAFARGVDLYLKLCKGKITSKVIDIYPNPYKQIVIKTTLQFIEERLGVEISKNEISQILSSLGFIVDWHNNTLAVTVPSYRAKDVSISEDLVEEIARLYGYHNLPSELTISHLPPVIPNSPFAFESKIKKTLSGWAGIEVYTPSLVSREKASLGRLSSWVLKLKNPLGLDSEYLRLSLAPSLIMAVGENKGEDAPFHLFEMANVYLPVRAGLPEEKMTLAGIFSSDYDFARAKGIVEGLLETVRADAIWIQEDASGFLPHHHLVIRKGKVVIGQFGTLDKGLIYYEFDVAELQKAVENISYRAIPKYPAQVEDITLVLPPRTPVGSVLTAIQNADSQIVSVELIDSFENTRTIRIAYQNPNKTLRDSEVEKIRKKVIGKLKRKFDVRVKA